MSREIGQNIDTQEQRDRSEYCHIRAERQVRILTHPSRETGQNIATSEQRDSSD
jgi:hypothetical protein